MDIIKQLLRQASEGVDTESTSIISDGLIDSIELVSFICLLEKQFQIEIPLDEITPENFDSCEAVWKLVEGAANG